jgi:hypothetical protein
MSGLHCRVSAASSSGQTSSSVRARAAPRRCFATTSGRGTGWRARWRNSISAKPWWLPPNVRTTSRPWRAASAATTGTRNFVLISVMTSSPAAEVEDAALVRERDRGGLVKRA